MRKSLSVLVVASLVLTSCGYVRDSALNPGNWFGRSRSVPVKEVENTNPLIPQRSTGLFARRRAAQAEYLGEPFGEIIDLRVERIPGGAIIRATGRADRQGVYEVRLTPTNEDELPENGVLTYRFEGRTPEAQTAVGKAPTREVTAARRLTDQQLAGVRTIRIEGARNARVARR